MKKITVPLLLCLLTFNLFAQDITKNESSASFNNTLKRIEADIDAKGLKVFAKINHMKAAKEVGLKMKPAIVIIFGNPSAGTILMNDNMDWSYELPLKIAVYEDKDGKIWVRSRKLASDIPSKDQSKRIEAINNLLMNLVKGEK